MNTDSRDPVYSLADLEQWKPAGPCLAVVGKPIKHSLSPVMHHAALADLASTDAALVAWRYHKFELAPEELTAALPRFHAAGFVGLNFTVPHKEVVLELANDATPFARAAGAANTLERVSHGWRAHNTDGYGLAAAILEEFKLTLTGRDVVLLGAGGAARAAAMQCIEDGASSITILNRSQTRLDALFGHLQNRGVALHRHPHGSDAILINATSLGLNPTDPAPIDLAGIPRPACVYDMIYNPPQTALLREANRLGIPNANGLSMLVHQGAKALSIWTSRPARADLMKGALLHARG